MSAPPSAARRRRQTAELDRPLNARLYRIALAGALLVVLVVSFAVSTPPVLPAPPPPAFDGAAATSLARELSTDNPARAPGTPGAARAADWVSAQLESFGYHVQRQRFAATIPGRGSVPLQNVIAAARGQSGRAIVVLAYRDDVGVGPGANANASGTAALLELARLYGTASVTAGGGAFTPTHTLIFVSTDGGAYGNLGAAHFADGPGIHRRVLAAVNLAAIAGRGRPRFDIAGGSGRSPAAQLVATANARIRELTGREPRHTGVVGQLIDLAFPLSLYDHAPFAELGVPAITLTTAPVRPPRPFGDGPEKLSSFRLGQVGSAAQALVDSLDQGLELQPSASSYVVLGRRIVSGWAIELALIALGVPVALALADMLLRRRRLGLELLPAARAQARRIGFWLFAALLFWTFSVAGIWLEGASRPPSPDLPGVVDWPVLPIAAFLVLLMAGWLVARVRLGGPAPMDGQAVSGYIIALGLAVGVAAVATVSNPYALLFVLPSLHAWLWLVQLRGARTWWRVLLYAAGFVGPAVLLLSLGVRFGLGFDAPWYLADLVAVGYVGPLAVIVAACWLAAAGQIGSLAFGRYAPYPARAARRELGMVALARRLHTPSA